MKLVHSAYPQRSTEGGATVTKPWVEGPQELLRHGMAHLQLGSDFDARIAMISIDNAVELMIKTYLGLPSRVTDIKGLSRREYEEMCESFPSLLDGFEKFAPDKIVGIELGDIEWFHRLRNQLYHEGNGITVERVKVEGYAEIAKILFSNLFGFPAEGLIEDKTRSLVGEFFSDWARLEQGLMRLREKRGIEEPSRFEPPSMVVKQLERAGILPESLVREFDFVRQFRNELAHGFATPSADDLRSYNAIVKKLLKTVSEM